MGELFYPYEPKIQRVRGHDYTNYTSSALSVPNLVQFKKIFFRQLGLILNLPTHIWGDHVGTQSFRITIGNQGSIK